MKVCWSVRTIPELEELPDYQKSRIMRLSLRRAFRHWESWFGLLFCVTSGILGQHMGHNVGEGNLLFGLIGGGIGGGVFGFLLMQMQAVEVYSMIDELSD